MNKKGFSLIELLAVIAVLALIAIIATPIVVNIINKSKINTNKESVNGLVRAASNIQLIETETGVKEDKVFYVQNGKLESDDLKIKGDLPGNGIVYIKKNGKVAVALQENNVCYKKGFAEKQIKVTENPKSCDLISEMGYEEGTIASTLTKITPTNYKEKLKASGVTGLVKYNDNKTYFTGAVLNNYVWFGGFKWRIVNVDQSGNIKLITDVPLTIISVGEEYNEKFDSLKDTYVAEWLTEEFLANFSRKKDLMTVNYLTRGLTSDNTTWLSKVSLLTVDEATKLGMVDREKYAKIYGNINYYNTPITNFFRKDDYQAFADIGWDTPGNKSEGIRIRYISGTEIVRRDMSQYNCIRPVVTIPGTLKIESGDGTEGNPYVFEGENEATTVSTMAVGEYLTLPNGDDAMMIAKDDTGYKFLLKNVTEVINGGLTDGSTNQFTLANISNFQSYQKITNYFNGVNNGVNIMSYLDTTNSHNWYIGAYNKGEHYNKTLEVVSDYKGAYAFLRMGEIMQNPDFVCFYTMTPVSDTTDKTIFINGGFTHHSTVSAKASPRPAFYLRGDIVITGGTGSYVTPYTIN